MAAACSKAFVMMSRTAASISRSVFSEPSTPLWVFVLMLRF
jgi:hypothetical protein